MSAIHVHAIVEGGRLRPLEAVALIEGQTVQVVIMPQDVSNDERVRALLGDLVEPRDPNTPHMTPAEYEAVFAALQESLAGRDVNLSEAIIEERREGL